MLVSSTSPAGVTYEFESCIACGRGRGGTDAYYCEVCLDNGAPEMVLNDSPFFTSDEIQEMEAGGEDPPPHVPGPVTHPPTPHCSRLRFAQLEGCIAGSGRLQPSRS